MLDQIQQQIILFQMLKCDATYKTFPLPVLSTSSSPTIIMMMMLVRIGQFINFVCYNIQIQKINYTILPIRRC